MSSIAIEASVDNLGDMAMAKRIFAIPDTLVVAIGPPTCIRILYFRALECGQLSKLKLIPISALDYTFGDYLDKIKGLIETALRKACHLGIILYVSCPDLLSQTDFDTMIQGLDNPRKIPVEIFKRGPMEKRKTSPSQRLDKIAAKIEDFVKTRQLVLSKNADVCELPPLAADYSGVLSLFPDDPAVCQFLLTGSGCANCPSSVDRLNYNQFIFSRFDDLQAVNGCTNEIGEAIKKRFQMNHQTKEIELFLSIGTPVTFMTGMNDHYLQASDLFAITATIDTNGFQTAEEGAAKALLKIARETLKKVGIKKKRINIIGYNPFLFGKRQHFHEIETCLTSLGYTVNVLGYESLDSFKTASEAELNLVFSRQGLSMAKWMEEMFQIPYLFEIPIGIDSFNRWLRDVGELLKTAIPESYYLNKEPQQFPTFQVLLLGRNEILDQLETAIPNDFGITTIRGMKITDLDLQQMTVTHVIGDPLYQNSFNGITQNFKFIPMPYPSLSGNAFMELDYQYMGQTGYAYLKSFFSNKVTA
ncbi:nitrogenase component 1 [Acetobacterium malicum]|uniref:nitrogenase component 1 n=1 Tax=Acetobacterium malicum TaxID=52692 RepID=UPI00042A74CF|nr:nitrogenase component 1 [Acetobacterium dehalogenans]